MKQMVDLIFLSVAEAYVRWTGYETTVCNSALLKGAGSNPVTTDIF